MHYVEATPSENNTYSTTPDLKSIDLTIWANTLVGYFIERKLPFEIVTRLAHAIWDTKGSEDVILQGNDIYFFRFKTSDKLNDILGKVYGIFLNALVSCIDGPKR